MLGKAKQKQAWKKQVYKTTVIINMLKYAQKQIKQYKVSKQ